MPYKVLREIRRNVVDAVAQYCLNVTCAKCEYAKHHDCLDIMQAKMLSEMYTITKNEVYELLKCPMHHDGTCWGTRDKETCTCGGFKQFCTHYPKG